MPVTRVSFSAASSAGRKPFRAYADVTAARAAALRPDRMPSRARRSSGERLTAWVRIFRPATERRRGPAKRVAFSPS